ncbi:ribbon-helix-helix domain-containing protein [Candidatus Poriferisodalis sp.]|uniref:ribbon-helix-helix domain-containing protein n=1 Tax=Candidatus Poriferisodalis sp. TaxID=3101277 RepID=UPI003C6F089D
MTTPIPTRFSERQTQDIDRLVAAGVGTSRSDVVRQAVDQFVDSIRRALGGEAIAESYRQVPQGPEDDAAALANAIAMTEAEPW